MRVLAGAGVWGTGSVATHTGLGWMGGLVLRMVLAFNVDEPGRTEGGEETSRELQPPLTVALGQTVNTHTLVTCTHK